MNKLLLTFLVALTCTQGLPAIAATTTVNFDQPRPTGNSGSMLNGLFQGIDFGSNQWRWEGPYGVDTTNHIYFHSAQGSSRSLRFSPSAILSSLLAFAGRGGTLTLRDDQGQTKTQSIRTGSIQGVTTGWSKASNQVTVQFSNGWELGITAIVYAGAATPTPPPPTPDTTAPTVAITAPSSGATVWGTITLSANASDNVAVAGVQFKFDGVNVGAETTSAPYSISVDTTTTTNGSHSLTAVARDPAGNSTTSSALTVTVSNTIADTQTPSVPQNLAATAISSSQINLTWNASADNVKVTGYRIYRSGTLTGTAASASYSVTGLSPSTAYSFTVAAFDAAGNLSARSNMARANTLSTPDTTRPTISLTAPSNDATVSGIITLSANASDNVGVVGVQFKLDGNNVVPEDTTVPYSVSWNTATVANGAHTLTAVARDAAGNQTTSASVSITVSNSASGGAGLMLRFLGNGMDDMDRIKIQIDNPTNANPGPPADVGAEDFTIEFWMRGLPSENTAAAVTCGANNNWIYGNIIVDRDRYNQDRNFGLSIAGGRFVFGVMGNGTGARTICGATNILDNQWHHISIQRRRADGFMWLFVDGVLEAQADGPDGDISYPDNGVPGNFCGGPCTNSDPYLVIAAEKHDAGSQYPSFSGWFDEMRISKVLRYSANFARPTTPFVTDANTVALYHFDEGGGDVVNDTSGAAGGPSNGIIKYGVRPAGPLWDISDAPLGQ